MGAAILSSLIKAQKTADNVSTRWCRFCSTLQFDHLESVPVPSAMLCYKAAVVNGMFLDISFFVTVLNILLLLPV